MSTFAKQTNATQHAASAKSAIPERAHFNHSRGMSATFRLQRAIGNQSVQELLQTHSTGHEVEAAAALAPRMVHDVSQVPADPKANANDIRRFARSGITGAASTLPHLDQIQRSFGPQHDLSAVKAYVGNQAAIAAEYMGAEAYTSGEHVAFRAMPSLHTAAHEAAHVIQQRSGVRVAGGFGEKGDLYERHADAVADSVAAGRPSQGLLAAYAGTVGTRPSPSFTIQCLEQDRPYVGPLASYLNPINQLARIALPGLSDEQKALLDGIFGNSLATSIIRLNTNSLLATGNCYRTTGNIINMPGTTIGETHLIHEAAHVWQHQNASFGIAYAISALRAQAIAAILGGDWQQAYDYSKVERYRIPWRFWNAEQQASWIEHNRRLPSGWMINGVLPSVLTPESAGL